MAITVISSREFNQDTGRAKKAALTGPVFITDRGVPSFVLMRIEEYRNLTGVKNNIAELLSMHAGDAIEFDPSYLSFDARVQNFS